MKPETQAFLEKSREYLSNAHAILGIHLNNDAGRNAYLAVFHAQKHLSLNELVRS